jgi:hypothetical protein
MTTRGPAQQDAVTVEIVSVLWRYDRHRVRT